MLKGIFSKYLILIIFVLPINLYYFQTLYTNIKTIYLFLSLNYYVFVYIWSIFVKRLLIILYSKCESKTNHCNVYY